MIEEAPSVRPDRDTGVYVMSVAAHLAGLHPQRLRLYERRGLVEPVCSRYRRENGGPLTNPLT